MKEFFAKLVNRILAAIASPILLYCTFYGVVAIYNLLAPSSDENLFQYFSFFYMFAFFLVSIPLFILIGIPVSMLIDRFTTNFRWITYTLASGLFAVLMLLFNYIVHNIIDMFVFGSIILYCSAGLTYSISLILIEKLKS